MKIISKNLLLYKFLASKCTDETYPPFDGTYLNYAYGSEVSPKEVKKSWEKTISLIKKNKAPKQVGIYTHWPYCVSKCTYCFCDSHVSKSHNDFYKYLQLIKKELYFFSDVFRGINIHSIFMGGGTPTLIPDDYFSDLFETLKNAFTIDKNAQICLEGSPHTLTYSKLKIMAKYGVNRLSIGVQSLDPNVLKKVNRLQTRDGFERSYGFARKLGAFNINIDLIAGLEGQSIKSFINDLRYIILKKPDMISLYLFDPRTYILFSQQGKKIHEEKKKNSDFMIKFAEKMLWKSGYIPSKMYQSSKYYTNFVDDRQGMHHWGKYNASLLGIGYNAVSHAFGTMWYQHPSSEFNNNQKLNYRKLPPFISIRSDEIEEMRKFVIFRLRDGFSRKEFKDVFRKDISNIIEIYNRLRDLERIGKLSISKDFVSSFIESNEEYLVLSKHLYSDYIINNILETHKDEYEEFIKKYDIDNVDEYLKKIFSGLYRSMSYYKRK